ncbi:MAG: amidohydrolase family protein, partial [Hyphomicrobiales bacterium]|nr:amidohydrolase family protein [Hyphomicrobiales bacterium]
MAQDAGTDAASIFGEPKVDCHCHVLDPAIHPYGADTPYRPEGQEIGTPAQMRQVFETYGVQRALLVQPNSGYGYDNSCLLAAIAASGGRWRGVATAPRDASVEDLGRLKAAGIVGVAINATFHGVDHYRDWAPLADRLAELDLFLQVQAEGEQWLALMPLVRGTRARLLIDHCGRPDAAAGL